MKREEIQKQAELYAKDDYRHPVTTMQSFYDGAMWALSHQDRNPWISNVENPAVPDEDWKVMKKHLYVFHIKGLNPYCEKYHIGFFVKKQYAPMWCDIYGNIVCFNENVDYYFRLMIAK